MTQRICGQFIDGGSGDGRIDAKALAGEVTTVFSNQWAARHEAAGSAYVRPGQANGLAAKQS